MDVVKKVQNFFLGAVEEEEDMFIEEEYEEEVPDDEPYYSSRERERERSRQSSSSRATSGSSRRSSLGNGSDRKVLSLPGSSYGDEDKKSIYICRPEVVDDATTVCNYLKEGIICAINLEGVERNNAQRIADFLGGACFALDGEIQRINNEVFIIAPSNIEVSNQIKEDFKSSGLVMPWISSALR